MIDKMLDKILDKRLDKIRDKHAAQDNNRNNPLMIGIQDSVDLYRQVNASIYIYIYYNIYIIYNIIYT